MFFNEHALQVLKIHVAILNVFQRACLASTQDPGSKYRSTKHVELATELAWLDAVQVQ
jgi:hypothetical protein